MNSSQSSELQAQICLDKGIEHLKDGQVENALCCFDEVAQLMPGLPIGYWMRGVALNELKRHEEAVWAFQDGLDLAPGDPTALFNLGAACLHTGRYEAARMILLDCIKGNQLPFGMPQLLLGFAVGKEQDVELPMEFADWLEDQIAQGNGAHGARLELQDPLTNALLALASAAWGEYESALASARRLYEIDPRFAVQVASVLDRLASASMASPESDTRGDVLGEEIKMKQLVLLGDSIFDNGIYVDADAAEPAVIQQVQARLPEGWQSSLVAVDGNRIGNITTQLAALPSGATHLALSIGGNDVLDQFGLLREPARSMAQALERLAGIGERFQAAYRRMLHQVLERGLPTMVCTIYEGDLGDPVEQRLGATALKVFNDAILREAIAARVPVLDLRLVCCRPEDFTRRIEPSVIGGDKIATGIVRVMAAHDFSGGCQQIYG